MKTLFLILFALVILASCKKSNISADSGCISRIKVPNHHINSTDSVAAVKLLLQNGISYNNIGLQFVGFDTVKQGPNAGIYQNVFVVQYLNGLPMLSGDLWYQFKNSALQSLTGTRYNSANSGTYSIQSLAHLRSLYLTEVSKNTNPSFAATFKDSCLTAQLGYYDLSVATGGASNLALAWSIKPENTDYPQVFFRDDNGLKISYNGGPVLD